MANPSTELDRTVHLIEAPTTCKGSWVFSQTNSFTTRPSLLILEPTTVGVALLALEMPRPLRQEALATICRQSAPGVLALPVAREVVGWFRRLATVAVRC